MQLPAGTYIRLRPQTAAFVDLAAAIGPRDLLEAAFRSYSALSSGEKIVIEIAGDRHSLEVVEARPGGSICLFGNLDLEVDFEPLDTLSELATGTNWSILGER